MRGVVPEILPELAPDTELSKGMQGSRYQQAAAG